MSAKNKIAFLPLLQPSCQICSKKSEGCLRIFILKIQALMGLFSINDGICHI